MRPSCGSRVSAMSRLAITLSREITRLTGTSAASTSMDSVVVVDSINQSGTSDFVINYTDTIAPPGFGGSGGDRRLVG